MAYRDYIADTKTLALITQTVNAKNAVIPGVTVNAELAGLVQAQVAEFYYNLAPAVAEADAGADFNTSQAGSKKAVLPLTKALHIDEKIPNAAVETTDADVLADRIVKGSLALSNRMGAKFISALETYGQSKEYTNGQNFYDAIVDGVATFSSGQSTRLGSVSDTSYSNKENGVQPDTILVGDAGRAALLKTEQFQRITNATGEMPNLIGNMFGLNVVYAQDLTSEFALINSENVAFPYAINTLRVIDSENFNGVRVQGEVAYSEPTEDLIPIDSHVMVFTEGVA
mgnify:CR=1 FL=1